MADYSYIKTKFWTDADTHKLSPEGKLIYIYLFSNPHRTQSGIYSITTDRIAFDTGYPIDKVSKVLDRLSELNKIKFDGEIIWITNFVRHQPNSSIKVKKRIAKDLEAIGIHMFIEEFLEKYEKLEIPYRYPIDTLSTKRKEKKIKKTKEKESKPKEKKSEKKNTFLYQNYESLDYKHQKFAVRFIIYLKKEFPNYWDGLLKRYKNKRVCIRTTLENYLDTLDKLIRLDGYTWEQIIVACRFAINDDDNSGGFCWKDQFKTLCKLRESKGDKPKYISRWLSKANQQKRSKKTLASKIRDWGKQQRS